MDILSALVNLIASVSFWGSSSAKSAGTFHTHARSLPQFGLNSISLFTEKSVFNCKSEPVTTSGATTGTPWHMNMIYMVLV